MRDFKVRTWLVTLIVALLPCVAGAAGLGKLNVLSALGQPLNAEIELTATQEELATLNARLATPDAYRLANLQYNPVLPGTRLSIERRGEQAYVRITSSRPVNEPFIDLLIELTWAAGRLAREYTALVDPPGMAPAPAISTAPVTRPVPQAPMAAAPAAKQPADSRPITGAGGKEYGPIQRGETLGKIARSVLPEGVTLEQMLVGLYRSNPDAFIRKNLNLVRAGKVLRVPDKEDIAAISRGEAIKEYRTHVADWNAYRQKIAEAAGAAPAAEGRTTTSGKITAKVEDKAGAAPKDVVRLSKGELPGAAAGAGKGKPRSAAERARALEEEAVAREKALNEANERVAQLEKTVKNMQKLVELKSPGMAAAQQQAAKGKPEPAKPEPAKPAEKAKPEAVAVAKPEPAKPAEAPKPEAAKPEPAKPAEAPKPEAAKPAEVAKTAAPPADKQAEKPTEKAEAPTKPAPAPKAKPAAAPPPPPPEPDLIEQVLSEPLYLAAGGGVILLGGVAFWLSRRRRAQGDEGDNPPPKQAPKLGKAAADAAETAAVTAATTAATQSSAPAAQADEVDPLAEAEIYIAYGRDQQAEEILKEALTKYPKREDVQIKLLEIYSARKDKSAFGKLAGDLHKLTGGAGDNWTKAAGMGYVLDPANPLYAAGKDAVPLAPAGAAPAQGSDLDFDLGLGTGGGATTDISLDTGVAGQGTAETAVLDPGALEVAAAQEAPAAPLMPDFSLDAPGTEPGKADIALDAAPAQDSNVIDFQIELPKADEEPKTQHASAPAAPKDANADLDFKLDVPDLNIGGEAKAEAAGGDKDGHWYDVQTKFDLAKAYQEMGEKDEAKKILNDVIKEGDAEQKTQAQALLDNLG